MAPGFGGGAADKRYRVEFYVSGQNLLNRVNYTAYSFVQTSPFYGQPIAAVAAAQAAGRGTVRVLRQGLGVGDWGLGRQVPIPNPQSPNP